MASSTSIIADLAVKLRDPDNFAHSSAVLTRFIDQTQRILNFQQELVLRTLPFTLQDNRTLYRLAEIAPDVGRILTVRDSGRQLFEVPWRSLVHNDPRWYRGAGRRVDLWARIGNDLVVFYPATRPATTLSIVYVKVTTTPSGVGTDIEIPDEYATVLADMVELLALLRGRRLAEALDVMKRIPEFFESHATESIETGGHA